MAILITLLEAQVYLIPDNLAHIFIAERIAFYAASRTTKICVAKSLETD
jgi:hypothetical protein